MKSGLALKCRALRHISSGRLEGFSICNMCRDNMIEQHSHCKRTFEKDF